MSIKKLRWNKSEEYQSRKLHLYPEKSALILPGRKFIWLLWTYVFLIKENETCYVKMVKCDRFLCLHRGEGQRVVDAAWRRVGWLSQSEPRKSSVGIVVFSLCFIVGARRVTQYPAATHFTQRKITKIFKNWKISKQWKYGKWRKIQTAQVQVAIRLWTARQPTVRVKGFS